ncbi:MAG: GerMN domain-containing protein [Candidatus Sumerlaeaceae bacterium]|nr:GerMN domain-containing protein [Candidatus Sumerlaeaceae bacterium]
MSPRRDPYFGRFVLTIATIGLVVVVLGLGFIWYYFQSGTATSATNPLKNLFSQRSSLPPNQAMLYYTKDGQQLVGAVADLGRAGASASDRASVILEKLLAGKDSAFLRSPIPSGTRLVSVFVDKDLVIVNLSKEFMTNLKGGVDEELLAVYSIVNSLLYNIESVNQVQLLIDGETVPTLRGNIDLESPLIANSAITRSS